MPVVAYALRQSMNEMLGWLWGLPPTLVLVTVAVIIAAETALLLGMVLPGASAVLTLGVLARSGMVPLVVAAVTAAVAAVVGAQAAYLRGSRGRGRIPAKLRAPHEYAARWLLRLGPPALCLGQWLVGIRTLGPRLAGQAGMPYGRFASAAVPTAATWGATLTCLGYFVGTVCVQLVQWFGMGAAIAIGCIVVVVAILTRATGLLR